MARKAILETGYTFTPGASGVGSVVIPRAVQRERLILITNVTTNQVIYNFSDQNLKATSYTVSTTGGGGATANVQIYPDGPDVLTITATNLTPATTVSLLTRLSWTEAQA